MMTVTATQAALSPTPSTRKHRPSPFHPASQGLIVLSPESSKEGNWQENCGHRREPTAHGRQVLACERRVQSQQGNAPLLDRGKAGHHFLELIVDIFGI